MCGIAGILNVDREPVSSKILKMMTDALVHRGPDSEGLYLDRNLGLGHRRLAIIDLSKAGAQPMLSKDGRYVIVYNGEIYNFRQLQRELEVKGHLFHSRTDSEVVLRSFIEWGESCVTHFNGMFAFAIWDSKEQKLFLARDRYGIKPLYYTHLDRNFIFASETKAFFKHPDFKRVLDKSGLLEYMSFQNFLTSRTLLVGVSLFPAGHVGKVSVDGKLRLSRYWDFHFTEERPEHDFRVYDEELARLFEQAVNRQLVSDVELGAYLSSGIDSGSITAVAARRLPYLKSFTVGSDRHSASGIELAFDEREQAELMSYKFKTEHYEMVLKAGDMERALPAMTEHLEEPRVGQSYPNYYAAKLASKFCKVVLSGAGGDELFAGYPWRYFHALESVNFEDYIDRYYSSWQRLVSNSDLQKIFGPIISEVGGVDTRDIFKKVFPASMSRPERPEDYINASLYFEARTFLQGLLIVEDKLSMAHSLESRVPFLDNDLVDFAMRLPVRTKLKGGNQTEKVDENTSGRSIKLSQPSREGKLILRKMAGKFVPPEIADGRKRGFSAPDANWFKGESIDFIRRLFFDEKALIFEYFDRQTIRALIQEHLDGKTNRRLLIWSLLHLEFYFRNLEKLPPAESFI